MRAVKTWPRRRQVLGALRRAPRCSSRRRTRAAAASNVLAALRMLVERCAPHTALAGQRKRLDWHRRSEPNWLTVVRPSRLLPGEPASYDRPALPAPKAPLLRPYLAGNPPRFRLDRRQACCCGVGASGRQPGARPPSLATRVLLYAWDHHAAPLPRQLSLNIRRVCALPRSEEASICCNCAHGSYLCHALCIGLLLWWTSRRSRSSSWTRCALNSRMWWLEHGPLLRWSRMHFMARPLTLPVGPVAPWANWHQSSRTTSIVASFQSCWPVACTMVSASLGAGLVRIWMSNVT